MFGKLSDAVHTYTDTYTVQPFAKNRANAGSSFSASSARLLAYALSSVGCLPYRSRFLGYAALLAFFRTSQSVRLG